MNKQNELPDGWEVVRLGDFAVYQKGKKPKNISNVKSEKFSIPYVNIKAFEKNVIDEFTDGEGCVLCEYGDFLMVWDGARSGFVGKGIRGALGSTLVKINFPGIDLNYAYYYLQSKYLLINTNAKGTGIPHVDPNLLWNFDFPIPPLPEQHRIVAKIEELFSRLDKGIESLKTAWQQLKTYRQAVLKWAFEGRLTKSLNRDLSDYDDEHDTKTNHGNHTNHKNQGADNLPEGWVWKTFGDCTINFDGRRIPLSKEVRSKRKGSFRYYGATEIVDYIDDYLFDGQYLLIGEDGANLLSKTKPLAFIVEGKFWLNNHAHIVQAKEGIDIKYLCYYFNSLTLNEFVTGTAQPKLTQANMNKINVCIPASLSEQHLIVSEIEKRLSVADKLEEAIATALQQAEALRQSILKKAFEGKLLSEAELQECRQDPEWEPASVLLERIASAKLSTRKAEGEKNKPAKSTKKSKQSIQS